MNTTRLTTFVTALTAAFLSTAAFAHEGEDHPAAGASDLPKDYPLTKCVVSGDKLGGHGKVVKVTSNGTDVYLCCKSCVKDFNKEPAKYVKMVKDAKAKATK